MQRAHESTGGDEVRTLQACIVTLHEQLAKIAGNAYTADVMRRAAADYEAAAIFEKRPNKE